MAWTNNVLRVNLTDGTCASEPLNTEWAKKYLGTLASTNKISAEQLKV